MLKKAVFLALITFLVVNIQGCAHDLRTLRYSVMDKKVDKDGKPSLNLAQGLSYALPKTVLDVSVPYTVITRKTFSNGIEDQSARAIDVQVEKPISIVPRIVADLDFVLVASGEKVSDSMFLESDLSFVWTTDGILSAAGMETTDKSIDAAKSLVSAGVQIAAIAAIAGPGELPTEIDQLKRRVKALYGEIATTSVAGGKNKTAKLAELRKELDFIHAVLDDYSNKNKIVEERREILFSTTLDPASFVRETDFITSTLQPGGVVEGIQAMGMPLVKIQLRLPPERQDAAKTFDVSANGVAGLIYRIPAPLELVVSINSNPVLRQIVNFTQYGGYGTARFASKAMSARTTKVAFSQETGGLKEYGVKSGSSADKAAAALDESLQKVKGAIIDYKYDAQLLKLDYEYKLKQSKDKLKDEAVPAEEPTKVLKEQKDMMAAELEVVKMQIDLEKAKKELADLKNAEDK